MFAVEDTAAPSEHYGFAAVMKDRQNETAKRIAAGRKVSMSNLKFSVITVSFNHAEFIKQTIESVLLQKYPNFEHIVVDGGSTDDTVSILKSYPHLQWTSESDRGQSHALNKGFKRATGDVIAWLNSDDWYAPGIFNDVALALEEYPLVMGACELTDKQGVRIEVYPNIERNWFDILKYWIFHSSPSQPSIFFRRDLLEQVKLPNGNYIDEDLDFCMDYDLWLRMCEKKPLARRIPKIFSYYRTYESNKTGELMDATYREMSRVYRRHCHRLCMQEKEVSYVIPVAQVDEKLPLSVASVAEQRSRAVEMVVVDHATDRAVARKIRRQVIELGRTYPQLDVRYSRAEGTGIFDALQWSVTSVRAPLVSYVAAGDIIPGTCTEQIQQTFEQDNIALALPIAHDKELQARFSHPVQGGLAFRLDTIFITPFILPNFVARHAALQELNGFVDPSSGTIAPLLAFRQFMLRSMYKGWQISVHSPLAVPWQQRLPEEQDLMNEFQLYINSYLIQQNFQEFQADSFAQTRIQHGFCIVLPEQIRISADRLLALAPKQWASLTSKTPQEELLKVTQSHPHFAPAWALLRKQAGRDQNKQLLERATSGFDAAKQYEASL